MRSRSPFRTGVPLALVAVAVLTTPPVASAATTGPRVAILGFTTAPRLGVPTVQAKPGKTITQCFTRPPDNRDFSFVWQAKGISRSSRVGVAIWGGPPSGGFAARPKIADVAKTATRWGKGPLTKVFRQVYGFSFGPTGFGPQRLDGPWSAMVVVNGKSAAFASVTVACD